MNTMQLISKMALPKGMSSDCDPRWEKLQWPPEAKHMLVIFHPTEHAHSAVAGMFVSHEDFDAWDAGDSGKQGWYFYMGQLPKSPQLDERTIYFFKGAFLVHETQDRTVNGVLRAVAKHNAHTDAE